LVLRFPAARLGVDEVAKLLQQLDLLWADTAQLVEYLAPDGTPFARARVVRPAVEASGLAVPHEVAYASGRRPIRSEQWALYQRILAAPTPAERWLAGWVEKSRAGWSDPERAQHDAALTSALHPRTMRRLAAGGGDEHGGADPLGLLLRRVLHDAARVSAIGGPIELPASILGGGR
jgi:hypothetical protein